MLPARAEIVEAVVPCAQHFDTLSANGLSHEPGSYFRPGQIPSCHHHCRFEDERLEVVLA